MASVQADRTKARLKVIVAMAADHYSMGQMADHLSRLEKRTVSRNMVAGIIERARSKGVSIDLERPPSIPKTALPKPAAAVKVVPKVRLSPVEKYEANLTVLEPGPQSGPDPIECRYIFGEGRQRVYCNRPRDIGCSWCEGHAARVFMHPWRARRVIAQNMAGVAEYGA